MISHKAKEQSWGFRLCSWDYCLQLSVDFPLLPLHLPNTHCILSNLDKLKQQTDFRQMEVSYFYIHDIIQKFSKPYFHVFRGKNCIWSFNNNASIHTTRHLHSGTIVLNCVMFMFRSWGLGNSVCFLSYSMIEYKHDTIQDNGSGVEVFYSVYCRLIISLISGPLQGYQGGHQFVIAFDLFSAPLYVPKRLGSNCHTRRSRLSTCSILAYLIKLTVGKSRCR